MAGSMGEHPPLPQMKIPRLLPWLTATQTLNSSGEDRCGKYKSAYIREPFTTRQIDNMWAYLGKEEYTGYQNPDALIQIDSYGSAVNKADRRGLATAAPQRDSIMKMQYQVYWTAQDADEPEHLAWIRDTYRATFTETGGVPTVSTPKADHNTDGCYINYPDCDLSDKDLNSSGEAWSTLYYKNAYPKLREVKTHWDPHNVFNHYQSIEPLHHG